MLDRFIPMLIKDLDLGNTTLESGKPGIYHLPLDDLRIAISTVDNTIVISCSIAPFPKANEEGFATQIMQGNLFGKDTHDSVLGTTIDGNTLTLTHIIDYQVDYKSFKDILQDYINALDYWREQAVAQQG